MDSGYDVEEILTGFQDNAAGPGADVVDDSTRDAAVRATEEGLNTEAFQTVTLTNSEATSASTLPRRERRIPLTLGDYVMGEELENLALQSEALALPGVPETAEEALGDQNWLQAMIPLRRTKYGLWFPGQMTDSQ